MKAARDRHNEMELLSSEQVERIYRVTDAFELHRDWVIVPLNCAPEGREVMQPDGKIILRAPGRTAFVTWLAELPDRLRALDLSRTPRRGEEDPKRPLTGLWGPKPIGTRRCDWRDHRFNVEVHHEDDERCD